MKRRWAALNDAWKNRNVAESVIRELVQTKGKIGQPAD